VNRVDPKEIVEDILEHHGVLGMKWGHRKGSSESGGGPSKRQTKKIAKADKKFEKRANDFWATKVALHNSTASAMNKHLDRINAKYQKDIDKGTLLNTYHPVTKKYHKEVEDAYLKELNYEASKMKNASGTKKYSIQRNDYTELGFQVNVVDVTHDSNNESFNVEFVIDDKGRITGFKLVNDTLVQSAIDDILMSHGDVKVRR
jgi:hypothetical protein